MFLRVVILLGGLLLMGLLAVGLAGFLLFRSFTATGNHVDLRSEILESIDSPRNVEVQVNVPVWLTTLARVTGSIGDVPEEIQAGLDSIHSGNVGVYELAEIPDARARHQMLKIADEALLSSPGWSRIVTILQGEQLVAIYLPEADIEPRRTTDIFVLVLDQRELVIVSARAHPKPILDFASRTLKREGLGEPSDWFGQ